MTTILCIGVVTSLVGFAIVLKTWASEPKKAKKGEKAAIVKQLLALSELENSVPAMALSRSRATRAIPALRTAALPRKQASAPQPVPSSQGR
jgi:hypothetical protein